MLISKYHIISPLSNTPYGFNERELTFLLYMSLYDPTYYETSLIAG